jgi:type III secretion protein L
MADGTLDERLKDLPAAPGKKIIRAKEAEAWTDGYRFLREAKSAYDAEHARGFADGKAAGAAEAADLINETVARVDRYIASLDQQIAALAVSIVRRVLGDIEVSDKIARAAAQALTEFRAEKSLKVTVHPEVLDRVRTKLAARVRESGLGMQVTVEPDPALAKDACTVASDFAVVDASVETQLNALAKAISTAAVEKRGEN